ncbi:hypothetical protein M2349_002565 [Caldanaerobacter subterraneus subsp. tengcongensis MB4]|nr:hypothetical protein [Caldanaerobacter subterraneus]MCS3917424.1 hypothetical protein [Caldanaerobacter subterraneus subsp. tengcongensis MB4]
MANILKRGISLILAEIARKRQQSMKQEKAVPNSTQVYASGRW